MALNRPQKTVTDISKLGMAILLFGVSAAQAGTVDISFTDQVASESPGPFLLGTSVNLQISDTATPDELQFSLSANLTGSQELTRVYLDLPTAETAALSGISVSGQTIVGQPELFAVTTVSSPQTSSEWAATQVIVPNSANAAETGKNDLLLAFAAKAITGKTVQTETFDLTFQGTTVTAADFLSLTSGVGKFNGFAEIALQGGVTGSGTGDLAGVGSASAPAIPIPSALPLFATALMGFGVLRRKETSS